MNKTSDSINKISVILPTYNERDNISSLILAIHQELEGRDHEIIVVDDDSPDGTWKVVRDMTENNDYVKLNRRHGMSGLTSAISEGIENCKGNIVMWMDADFSHHPKLLNCLLEQIGKGYDIAVGSRYVPGGGMVIIEKGEDSLFAAILSFIMNFFIQKLLDPSFKDYTSGFIAARREVFDTIKLRGDYGEYFIDLIYRAIKKKYKIIEIPYVSGRRRYGSSKTGSTLLQYLRRGAKYLWATLRLKLTWIIIKK